MILLDVVICMYTAMMNKENVIHKGAVKWQQRSIFDAAPFIGIKRHCLLTDGEGVTTLVGFHGCPLSCIYCLNPQCKDKKKIWNFFTPSQLYDRVKIDSIYFQATGGGVVFGGGEPLLYPSFIKGFHELCKNDNWKLSVETALNVPLKALKDVYTFISSFIVDIKDMDPIIYENYTGKSMNLVLRNLSFLIEAGHAKNIIIRIPQIRNFNNEENVEQSILSLKEMGLSQFEIVKYKTDINHSSALADKDDSNVQMSKGKAICNVLKEIRKVIANANRIDYIPYECKHVGNCLGTCPRCDSELYELSLSIEALKETKGSVVL